MADRRRAPWPWLLAGLFVVAQVSYIGLGPFPGGPDEADHLAYVEALATARRLPTLAELPADIRLSNGRRIGVRVEPTGLPGPHTPSAQHPPLAHLAYAAGRLVGLSGRWLRLVGLLWGLAALVCLARLAAELFAAWPAVRDALPVVVLFPGPVYLCACVTNDGAALAAGAWVLWRVVGAYRRPPTTADALHLSLALAAALLTKASLLIFVPAALLAAARGGGRAGWGRVALVLLPVVGLAGWWYARNHALYGEWLVRAHARPLLWGWYQIAEAPDLFVMQVLYTAALWPLGMLAPGWLLLNSRLLSNGLCLTLWLLGLLAVPGLRRRWPAAELAERTLVGWGLGLTVVLIGLLLWQLCFQDFLVALHGGRYFLAVLPGLWAAVVIGHVAPLSPARQRLAPGVCLAAAVGLLLVFSGPVRQRVPGPTVDQQISRPR